LTTAKQQAKKNRLSWHDRLGFITLQSGQVLNSRGEVIEQTIYPLSVMIFCKSLAKDIGGYCIRICYHGEEAEYITGWDSYLTRSDYALHALHQILLYIPDGIRIELVHNSAAIRDVLDGTSEEWETLFKFASLNATARCKDHIYASHALKETNPDAVETLKALAAMLEYSFAADKQLVHTTDFEGILTRRDRLIQEAERKEQEDDAD
jgi:hypothetical protein